MHYLAIGRAPLLLATLVVACSTATAVDFPGPEPGATTATAGKEGGRLALANRILSCEWRVEGRKLRLGRFADRLANKSLDLSGGEVFRLHLADGSILACSDLEVGRTSSRALAGQGDASVLAWRFPGREHSAVLRSVKLGLEVDWRAVLHDGANAVRQELTFRSKTSTIRLSAIEFFRLPLSNAMVAGSVPGSVLVSEQWFFACEHPDSRSSTGAVASCSLPCVVELSPGKSISQSLAAGVTPKGQLRRGFLYYLERERAHPYRPFLHYNAWYDICWGNRKINEAECLNAIEQFGRELIEQRHTPLDSFVWDDGWDDPGTLWRPLQANFPRGFREILAAARGHKSTLGFWLSPFGGYGEPQQERLRMGKEQGFETGRQGFVLSGTRYYGRFLETCLGMVESNGCNFFKFDGLARGVEETEAMLRLTRRLRESKPDLFVSITTGTWPSPFWLWYGDSTWRGGNDMGFEGPGSKREQWINYRDADTYQRVVRRAPLYPLNSLMTQGFAHARYGPASQLGQDPGEIRRELESFFASGTCLQELYVTPEKMSARNWDDLAECARWSRSNAEVLADTHWVGGDPGKGEIYGWASWSARKAILALRNPSPQAGMIELDMGAAFELPPGSARAYVLKSPWAGGSQPAARRVVAGTKARFELEPFGVLVFDALPE